MPVVPKTEGLEGADGASVPLYPKLKPGPGLAADLVIAHQRARLRGAMIELAAERGYSGVTVRGLARLAGVSTKTFYECFENIGDCFSATYLWVVRSVLRRTLAVDSESESDRVRTRVAAIFSFLAENPKAARLVLLEAVSASSSLDYQTRTSALAFERLVSEELLGDTSSASASARPVVSHAAVGAGIRVMRTCLLAGRDAHIPELAEPFADWLLALRGASLDDLSKLPDRDLGHARIRLRRAATVVGNERQLLQAATVKLALRDGYGSLTAPAIRREAGLSRRAFEENFDGPSDCFLAAVDSLIADACGRAEQEAKAGGSWERRVVRTLECLCADLAREPAMARLALVEIFAPGPPGLKRREDIVGRLANRLRRTAPAAVRMDEVAAEASVAGAWRIAKLRIVDGRTERVQELAGGMAFVVLAPAIGAERAERAILAGG